MLFNSYIFIFGFLPAVLLIYWGLHRAGQTQWALSFLIPASLIFYAYWNPPFVLLLLSSIVFNFLSGRYISMGTHRKLVLGLAIAINLGLLAWFKYASLLTGLELNIFLPLGISFFTFHQITYLTDIYKGKFAPVKFRDYAFYVGFFPQLIAGPIVRAWEIIPQLENFTGREKFWRNMAEGSALFIMGLFKKVAIADTLALYATPVFSRAQSGEQITFFDGWSGSLAYTFQLYFDFSGYSDMALGLALMLGFVLPINFFSPYKSTSVTEFWQRWHITMSRFFRDYVYIPMGGNRVSSERRILNLLFTMFFAGLWHGAGWTFAAWGFLHGIYLIINHVFTVFRERVWPHLNINSWRYKIPAHIVTMLAVVVGWVLFRAEDFGATARILKAMAGADGIVLPLRVFHGVSFLGTEGWLRLPGVGEKWIETSFAALPTIAIAYTLCLILPSSVEYFSFADGSTKHKFRLNKRTAGAFALMGVMALFCMQRISEFLYFQF